MFITKNMYIDPETGKYTVLVVGKDINDNEYCKVFKSESFTSAIEKFCKYCKKNNIKLVTVNIKDIRPI